MPNRILRDWTDSDRIEQLTCEAERFFVRLIMKVDDYGRYHADPKRLKPFLFPLKDSIRVTDISRWLAECEKAGLVRCYESDSKRYVEIRDFRQRLRLMKELHPRPPDDGPVTVACPRPSDSHSDSVSDSEGDARGNPPNVRSVAQCVVDIARGERLHGIPATAEDVVAFGRTLHPPVDAEISRAFFAHYEGQARTGPSGEVFWITSGEVVITNWKVRLPQFKGDQKNGSKTNSGSARVRTDRNEGTFNDGKADRYANVGNIPQV